MNILRKKFCSMLGAVASVPLLAWAPDTVAIDGGGLTPIGQPEMTSIILEPVPGPFDSSCDPFDKTLEFKHSFGGTIDHSHTFPGNGTGFARDDSVVTHIDETGVFWVTATSRSLNKGLERPRVDGTVLWVQLFIKDRSNAFVHFTVSKALLSINQALLGFSGGGACARIHAFSAIAVSGEGHAHHGNFSETALYSASSTRFFDFEPTGPMTFTKVEDPGGIGTITFDRFTGALDLSGIDVGQTFAVFFGAEAEAGTGASPEFPGEAIASYRDPITFDGGFSIETDGLTPISNTNLAPIPRDQSHAIVTQGDGKMVSAGSAFNGTNDDFGVARYNVNGSLDTTFDADGKLTTDFVGGADVALASAVQADGKLLVAGEADNGSDNDIAVARYNSDGSLDASFGAGGKVRLDLTGTDEVAQSIAVQADGKIVLAGSVGNGTERDFLVLRLNGDGSIDDGFGTHGFARLDFAGGADYVTALTLQSDGKIVLAGTANLGDTATQTDFALARFSGDGTIDGSFGVAGHVTTDIGSSADFVEALAVQPADGKLIVAGHTSKDADASFVIARYGKDGSLDADFASGGTLIEDFGGSNDYAYAVTAQSDGKILVAGYTQSASRDFAVLRLNASGAVDTTFGVDGKVAIDFSAGDDFAESMTLEADGKILVAGWAATATGDDFAMVRINP